MRPFLVEGQDYVKDGEMCRYTEPVPEEMTAKPAYRFVFSYGHYAKPEEFLDGLQYAPYVFIGNSRYEVGWRGRVVDYLTGPQQRDGAEELLARGCVEQLLVLREGSGRYEVAHLVENTPLSSADGYSYELDDEAAVVAPLEAVIAFLPGREGYHVTPDRMVEIVKEALAASGLPPPGRPLGVFVEIDPGSREDPTTVVLDARVEIVPVWDTEVRGSRLAERPAYRIDKWTVMRSGDYGGGHPEEEREEGGEVYRSPYAAAQEAVVEVVRDRMRERLAEMEAEDDLRVVGFEESQAREVRGGTE